MKIKSAELILIRLRLKDRFETSFGSVFERDIALLKFTSEFGESYSEVVTDSDPFYNGETVVTARHIIKDFIMPLLKDRDIDDGRAAHELLSKVRGNRMARAAVEMNIWNLAAIARGVPLNRLLGGTQPAVRSGVSVGIQESASAMVEKISHYLERGYQRIKVKIKPGHDVGILGQIRRHFPSIPLSVDANAAYVPADIGILRELDNFNMVMIEQPFSEDDLLEHATLAAQLQTKICLDESIENVSDCRVALRLGSCSIINIKPGRVAGFTESLAIHDACRAASVPVWCGGMLESGIGRAYNVHLASCPNFTLPGDISESARYWHEDIVEPPFELREGGFIQVPTGVGLGVLVREDLIRKYMTSSEKLL